MTATEAASFPDVAQGPPQTSKVFLQIRNRLVCGRICICFSCILYVMHLIGPYFFDGPINTTSDTEM